MVITARNIRAFITEEDTTTVTIVIGTMTGMITAITGTETDSQGSFI